MAGLGMQLYIRMLQVKQKFLEEERGAVDIVAIVVLIGIAVALALFFKDRITETLRNLFDNIDETAASATAKVS